MGIGEDHVIPRIKMASKEKNFTPLTPTDDAQNVDTYLSALGFAIGNDKIKDIALIGPYGSSKSNNKNETFLRQINKAINGISYQLPRHPRPCFAVLAALGRSIKRK